MPIRDATSFWVQRGGRLLLLSSDGKRLERLLAPTSLPPMPGLWASTGIGDRLFLVDAGADSVVYLSTGIRICVVDVASGRQRLLFPDGVIRDLLGRPVSEIEGIDGSGLSDWQLFAARLVSADRLLRVYMRHPIHGSVICAVDARTGAAVVTQSGTWRRMGSVMYQDEQSGVVASVERDVIDTPLMVSLPNTNTRLVIGVPAGATGKFGDVSVSPDGKSVAVILDGSALYMIDTNRRTSRKIATGAFFKPKWNSTGKSLAVIRLGSAGERAQLVDVNPVTLKLSNIVQNVDDYSIVVRKTPDWKTKPTP